MFRELNTCTSLQRYAYIASVSASANKKSHLLWS